MNALRLFALVMIVLLLPERSSACSCRPISLQEQFDQASIVFVATVIESRVSEPLVGQPTDVRATARFRVDEEFKGKASDVTALSSTVTLQGTKVDSVPVMNTCSRTEQFAIGSQFLVFATGPGEVEVAACSPTRMLQFEGRRILDEVRKMSVRK